MWSLGARFVMNKTTIFDCLKISTFLSYKNNYNFIYNSSFYIGTVKISKPRGRVITRQLANPNKYTNSQQGVFYKD